MGSIEPGSLPIGREAMHRSLVLLAASAALAAFAPAAAADDVLPDLDQVAPTGLQVSKVVVKGQTRFRLGFASAAANVGPGPLTLHGFRRSTKVPEMQVNQLIDQVSGTKRLVRDVGRMSYVVHPDHRHWHLLGFERYEIRRPGSDKPSVRHDRKTGFCLGDRYSIPEAPRLAGFNPTPAQGDTCGLGQPDILGLFAGISTGYADRYEAQIEGQYIDITEAPSRKYVLVHTVNGDGKLIESDYTNNASSALFSLTWPKGRSAEPRVRVLRKCPMSASCPG